MVIENNIIKDVSNSDIKNGMFVIPDNVTSIGEYAFCGCKSLIEVNIPDSVEFIGELAFYNCRSLESIKIPENCEFDVSVFRNCINLKEVN